MEKSCWDASGNTWNTFCGHDPKRKDAKDASYANENSGSICTNSKLDIDEIRKWKITNRKLTEGN